MKENYIVVGLGQTGLSCVKFLHRLGHPVCVVDTRLEPPTKAQFLQTYPNIPVFCNELPDLSHLKPFNIVLSPGIAPHHPLVEPLISAAAHKLSDISLFAQHNRLPIIAITGSNGKSTVTTLVGEMAKACGLRPAVVGNIGTPVLSILDASVEGVGQQFNLVVMELSSFQLDITEGLKTKAATVLNISPDHLDRYENLNAYATSKHKIYENTEYAIINREDILSTPANITNTQICFSSVPPQTGDFGLVEEQGSTYLCYGEQRLLNVADMKLMGQHNYLNALAALSLGHAFGLPLDGMLIALRNFSGLPHRCEWVIEHSGIQWINDSKGTNIGASVAALIGLGERTKSQGKIVLLLGGQGKGQDFIEMIDPITQYCRVVVTMGENGSALYELLKPHINTLQAKDMQQAVELAKQTAAINDIVLLSPACASFDQYQNFEHRGKCFKAIVLESTQKVA